MKKTIHILSGAILISLLLLSSSLASTIRLPVSEDAYISGRAGELDINFGFDPALRVGQSGENHGGQKSYFLFDASDLPEILDIAGFEIVRGGDSTIARTVQLYAILGSSVDFWANWSITWNNAPGNNVDPGVRDFSPGFGEEIISVGSASTEDVSPGQPLVIGFDEMPEEDKGKILEALNGGGRTVTFGLRYNSDEDDVLIFHSSRHEGGIFAPELELVFPPRRNVELPVSQDGYISGRVDELDTNFGSDDRLRIGQAGETHGGQKSYFLFNASELPEILDIESLAIVRRAGSISRTVRLYAILGPDVNSWTRDDITWNNAPGNNVNPGSRDFFPRPGEEIIFMGGEQTNVAAGETLLISFENLSGPDKLRILDALNEGSRTVTFGLRYNSGQDSVLVFHSSLSEGGIFAPKLNLVIEGSPMMSFADWVAAFELPAGQDGPGDNPAGDGIANVLKFALGLNPFESSRAGLPVQKLETIEGLSYLTLSFDRPENVTGLTYHVDASGDLVDWSDSAVELPNPMPIGDGMERVTFQDVKPVEGPDGRLERRFLRLRVELD